MPERAMVGGYRARDVAQLLGLSPAQIRAYVRSGFLDARRGRGGEYRFSLQDLVLLRTAKGLSERIPARKVRSALRRLKQQLPTGRPLTAVRITAMGDDVVVRSGSSAWKPESGQGLLDFEVSELVSAVAPLARRAAEEARAFAEDLTAENWYELGCDLEASEPQQAREAYLRALDLDPAHSGARVNLGRLLHEGGEARHAAAQYRLALQARPDDPTAAFNLGVALEDLGRRAEAAKAYEGALRSDPNYADAHFNLSRLLERSGKRVDAFVHLKAYKKLTQRH